MKLGHKYIDHLVYGVTHLEQAISELELLMGVKAVTGGRHKTKGTHNALINLGHKCYLELLAIDPDSSVKAPRWMGIDHLTSFKCLRWAIKSERIDLDAEILFTYNHQLACLDQGQRWTPDDKLLKWQMTLPLAEPEVELVPFLIDWSQSAQHPTDKLPVQCQLLTLDVSTPNPSAAQDTFDKLFGVGELTIGHSAETRLIATLDTPNGVLRL